MTMFIHFFGLCPLGLTIKLNFNILRHAKLRGSRKQLPLFISRRLFWYKLAIKKITGTPNQRSKLFGGSFSPFHIGYGILSLDSIRKARYFFTLRNDGIKNMPPSIIRAASCFV